VRPHEPRPAWPEGCSRRHMANEETEAPPAQPGEHYANPNSKPLLGPIPATDRGAVQRVVWPLFFLVLIGAIALALGLSLIGGS
jgi:hypothetical protein